MRAARHNKLHMVKAAVMSFHVMSPAQHLDSKNTTHNHDPQRPISRTSQISLFGHPSHVMLHCTAVYIWTCMSEFCVEAQRELFEPLLVCLQDVQLRTLLH